MYTRKEGVYLQSLHSSILPPPHTIQLVRTHIPIGQGTRVAMVTLPIAALQAALRMLTQLKETFKECLHLKNEKVALHQ